MALISKIKSTHDSVDYNMRDDVHTWGGRNLLLGTELNQGAYGTDIVSGSGTRVDSGGINGLGCVKTTAAWSGAYIRLGQALTRANAKIGDIYSLSVYVSCDSSTTVTSPLFYLYRVNAASNTVGISVTEAKGNSNNVTASMQTGKWIHLWCPFEVTDYALTATTARFEQQAATSYNLIWSGWKLEKGNKPTDWSPAPEDIAYVNGECLELLS